MIFSFKVKVKTLIVICLVVLALFFSSYFVFSNIASAQSHNALNYVIVLDAGHGGMDGGAYGKTTGVKESDLNLEIVKKLKVYLESFGFKVVLTRSNENGLYNVFSRDYKLEDMNKRKDIIQKNNANMVISIHLNAYPSSSLKGAQTFYDPANPSGKLLAETIQKQLFENIENAKQNINLGDYFILKCTQNPSVMIECGFLSNPEEEMLLQTSEYQEKLVYNIFVGVVKYFAEIYN